MRCGNGFRAEFVDNLTQVGEILENNGYDIDGYTGNLKIGGVKAAGHGETPEQAFEETLDDIDGDILVEIPGDLIRNVYLDEDADLSDVLYSNLKGSIEVEEPLVDWSKNEEQMKDVDPSADPTSDENIAPAFGLNIEYHPNQAGEGYWEVGSLGTAPAYTLEEAEEEVEQLAQILEKNGIEYELGPIN